MAGHVKMRSEPATGGVAELIRRYEAARRAADRDGMDRLRVCLAQAIRANGMEFADMDGVRYVPTDAEDDLMRFRIYPK